MVHQLLVYADDVYILGGSVHSVKIAEILVVASKDIRLEVNIDKTEYMVMSRCQNVGRNHIIKIDNSSLARVEEVKYLGTNLTHQNSIPEETAIRLKSGNACSHSVQNLLSYIYLSSNLMIKIYSTIILPAVLNGCETWLLILREERRLRMFENIQ